MASSKAMALANVEIYLLTKAMKGGRKELSATEKDFLSVLKGLGLKELSAEMVDALESGNYEQVIRLGKSIILHKTADFTLASVGLSSGPLSRMLGDALEASMSTPRDMDTLRTIIKKAKTEDPELAAAVERFLDGKIDSITILVARRAGADPKLMSIAENAAKGDVSATMQSTADYLGLKKEQTGLAIAAVQAIQEKKITADTIKSLANYAEKYMPEWKTSKRDLQAAYTIGVNLIAFIEIMGKDFVGPIPRKLEDVRTTIIAKRDFEATKIVASIASLGSIVTVAATIINPVLGVIAGLVFAAIAPIAGELHKLGDRQARESDEGWQRGATQWATTLAERYGTVAPAYNGEFLDSSMRFLIFMKRITEFIDQDTPKRDFMGDVTCPVGFSSLLHTSHQAAKKFVVMFREVQNLPEVSSLLQRMIQLSLGGPFTSYNVVSRTTLVFVSQVIASYYGIAVTGPLLAFSDALSMDPVVAKPGEDYSQYLHAVGMQREAPNLPSFVWTETATGEPEIYYQMSTILPPARVYYDMAVAMMKCPGFNFHTVRRGFYSMLWTSAVGECGNRYPGRRDASPAAKACYDKALNNSEEDFQKSKDTVLYAGHLFELQKGLSNWDNFDNDWIRFIAEDTVLVWGLILNNVFACADAYKKVHFADKTKFGSRQLVSSQIATVMDQNPKLLYVDAVKKVVTPYSATTVKELAKAGISPVEEPLVGRSIRAYVLNNPKVMPRTALAQLALQAGITPPIKKSAETDLWYTQRLTSYIMLKASTPTPSATSKKS